MTPRYPDGEPRIAVYAGSFDPFTLGHLSIVERAAAMFDILVVAVGCNAVKRAPGPAAGERVEAIREAVGRHLPALADRCRVETYAGELTADFARRCGARWLVRGARSGGEFEAEMRLADVNRAISGIETVIIPALPSLASCSSSVVRELRSYGHDASMFLP